MLGRHDILLTMTFLLAFGGCAPRGQVVVDPGAAQVGTVETIVVASSRQWVPEPPYFTSALATGITFAAFEVTVPPERKVGTVKNPKPGDPDPERQFLVAGVQPIANTAGFIRAVNREMARKGTREAFMFLHGYNTNFAEGLYRQAQLEHDLKAPGASVHFSWPSRGKTDAYLYDTEAALYSRDAVEKTIVALSNTRAERITLAAHSMGTMLLMDTLRGMARSDAQGVFDPIDAVVLISPDIDIDIFKEQAAPLIARGVPIYLLVSQTDKALKISARLRGERKRLGTIKSAADLGNMKGVYVINATDLSGGGFLGHFKEGDSPAFLNYLRGLDARGVDLFDQGPAGGVLGDSVALVQEGARIVLSPLTGG
jgi:esterase/lipase superfamily enzyme